ncbi:MAG: methylated-DNA--[protein]-cysteine S-methyltransferase [Burkholderiales bacterium]
MTTPPVTLAFDTLASPIGQIEIAVLDDHLVALDFADSRARMAALLTRRFGAFELKPARNPARICTKLRAYLAGDLAALDDIEVHAGGTAFQAQAWRALHEIPAGRTATYADQARKIGRPAAVRAVGAANARNPIAIVVPCHRVIGANGALTGYAGGIARKKWLLAHEARART